jgi:hypothetical protein
LGNFNGVRKLRGGISTKIADATGTVIYVLGQFFWANPFAIPHPFSMGPVLTEKAVKRTSVIEDGKVFKPIFWTRMVGKLGVSNTGPPWTDPIRYTIGWQPIIIPTHISLSG